MGAVMQPMAMVVVTVLTVRQTNKHAKRNCKAWRDQARMRCTTLLREEGKSA
jgi:hypothetical protein